jgi:hypothetical protein
MLRLDFLRQIVKIYKNAAVKKGFVFCREEINKIEEEKRRKNERTKKVF